MSDLFWVVMCVAPSVVLAATLAWYGAINPALHARRTNRVDAGWADEACALTGLPDDFLEWAKEMESTP